MLETEPSEAKQEEQLAQSILARAKNCLEQDGTKLGGYDYAFYNAPTPYIERPDGLTTFLLNLLFEKGISGVVIIHKDAGQETRKKGLVRRREIITPHPEFTTIQIYTRRGPDVTDVFQLDFEEGKMPIFYTYTNLYHKEIGGIPTGQKQREATLDDLQTFDWVMDNLTLAEPLDTSTTRA